MDKLLQLIADQHYTEAMKALVTWLNQIELGQDHQQNYLINRDNEAVLQDYDALAAGLSVAFKSSKCQLDEATYFGLCLHKAKIIAIFELSQANNTDKPLKALIKAYNRKKDQNTLMKINILMSFSNTIRFDPWFFLKQNPHLGIEAALGLLAKRRLIHADEQKRFEDFVAGLAQLQDWPTHHHTPVMVGQAWYQAAYEHSDLKYKILNNLNAVAKHWLNQYQCDIQVKAAPDTSAKPTVLIILEQFKSNHAMYRCFANGIEAMRARFRLVGLGDLKSVDDTSRALFDEFIPVQMRVPSDIQNVFASIDRLKPDCCYFTSVGMKYWSILLANRRLAPVQCVTAGHPVSSCCGDLDFMLLEDHKVLDGIYFHEQVLGLPSGTFGFVKPQFTVTASSKDPHTVKVALVASAYKLNSDFLHCCQQIEANSNASIEFHSFSGLRGLEYHQMAHKLRRRFKSIFVYPALDYNDYMQQLSACDLYLAPFPFGGTNSTIDCLLLSIPTIAIEYPDLAAADSFILKQVGLEQCLVQTQEDFIERAKQFIESAELRSSIVTSIQALDENLNGLLGSVASGEAYAKALHYAVHNHQALKASERFFIPSQETQ